MTTQEAALILDRHPATIRKYIKLGKLRARRVWLKGERPHYEVSSRSLARLMEKANG